MHSSNNSIYKDLNIDETLRIILEGTATKIGKEFFRDLVYNLSRALNSYGVWITELESEEKAKSIAFLLKGKWIDKFDYKLKDTPCELVIKDRKLAHIPDNVLELYPRDPDIQNLTPKPLSYMGIPLIDTNKNILGHIAVLDCKPMPLDKRKISIMKIFASRAVAEMQRLKAEADLIEREQKLSRIMDSAMDAIIEINDLLKVTQVNRAAEKVFGIPSKKIAGRNFATLLTESSLKKLLRIIEELNGRKTGEKYLWIPKGLESIKTDGSHFLAEATISEFELNEKIYYTLILRNVNERIEAEKKIESLYLETKYLQEEIKLLHNFEEIIGESKPLLNIIRDVKKVAPTDSTVLITGESGTGKELVARLIHSESKRDKKPLVKVNCAAIPSSLIESEFFGHEKGAFTGATTKRDGRFLFADSGTIFLDEIGELPLDLQPKLLRVLQEGEFEPVGSSKTVKVNVRVIAATNRDLFKEVEKGTFREDLYYRLNVFPIHAPPLRERGKDIISLAKEFTSKISSRLGLKSEPLTDEDIKLLTSYKWPGNIRELHNVIERAVITSQNGKPDIKNALPQNFSRKINIENDLKEQKSEKVYDINELKEFERNNILRALDKSDWKISGEDGAARLLGLPPTTLNSRIKALGIKRQH